MLDSLHIKNFRCFEDLTIPSLGRVNLIVGKNNSGKSTLLEAVSVFSALNEADDKYSVLNNLLETLSHISKSRGKDEQRDTKIFGNNLNENNKKFHNGESGFELTDNDKKINYKVFIKKENDNKFKFFINEFDFKINTSTLEIEKPEWMPSFNANENDIDWDEIFSEVEERLISNDNHDLQFYGYSCKISPANLLTENELSELWDEIIKRNKRKEVLETILIINEDIIDLDFVYISLEDDTDADMASIVRIRNKDKPVSLKYFGEGVRRLLQLILTAFQIRKGGSLLIDEFENGLHYSIQEEVWEKLFKLAKELDIQVFATTHSEDTVKAFSKVSLRSPEEGHLISLGRSAYGENKGKIIAVVHDENDLQYILDTGMEVR
ncbi:ATP-binding protein [Thiothrix unzii]|jgi:AAA15 family ATPase/GTPase|uniref:AAA family ATPase n=1 Tax=Thiothrix unzii TaxID=111769 RepID=UPI002A360B1D|nr:ATP-binding protein [Thiothrix unzii]MDX9988739.1 ATP-binding protein [Thiothrix unzii]